MNMAELELSDRELLQQLTTGDRSAFEVLYRRHWRRLYDSAHKRLNNRQQSEDIVQDVFFRLWVRRSELDIQDLSSYLSRAVRNQVLNYVTRQKADYGFYEPFATLLTDHSTADAALLAKEVMGLVEDYAATLPVKRREIFLLHMRQRLSTKEIAELLNISQKTVQNQLHAAMKGMRSKVVPVVMALLLTHL